MEPELWKAIQVLFDQIEESFDKIKADNTSDASEPEAPDAENTDNFDNMDLVNARKEIRHQFENIRIKLLEYLSEQESYQVLFPLVVYFDEIVRAKFLKEKQLEWPLLQKEFYDVDDGGELFYDNLNSILRKPQTSEFIFEVNYFCLKHGFQGKYVDDPVKIKEYIDKLETKISTIDMEGVSILPEDTGEIKYFMSPAWYYGGAVLFLIIFYGALKFIA